MPSGRSHSKRSSQKGSIHPSVGSGSRPGVIENSRGEANGYYDPTQAFGDTGVGPSQTQTQPQVQPHPVHSAGEHVYPQPPSEQATASPVHGDVPVAPISVAPDHEPAVKPGLRGTIRGFWHLARKKEHLTGDTPARLELLNRADKFFNEGFIGKYGGLNKDKRNRIAVEKKRVAEAIPNRPAT